MIVGERIILRCIDKGDIYKIMHWRNDPEIKKNVFSHTFINSLQQERWFENYCQNNTEERFMIVLKDQDEAIGVNGLSDIDYKNQSAILNTMIGERKYWNQGYAKEATVLIINYAFSELNLNRIVSYSYESNKAIQKKNSNLGFQVEGLLRQMVFSEGEFQNVVIMSLLRGDWNKQKGYNQG